MPKILHVAQPVVGGVPLYVIRVARGQVAAGARVEIAGATGGPFAQLTGSDVPVRHWSAATAPGPSTPAEIAALKRVIAATGADVIHLHSSKAGLAGRIAIAGRRPTVFQPHAWSFHALHGPLRAAAVSWERVATRWTDRVICVSEGERREGLAHGIHANYAVVPNGVDVSRWLTAPADRQVARDRLGLPQAPIALALGRVVPQKGHDILVDVWPSVRAEITDARLYILGDGPQRGELERAAPEGLRFIGDVTNVELWMAATNIVVLPSRYEGMSLAMLEAMAAARSVVTSDVAGARDAVRDDAGAVVPVEDREALVAAVVERLRRPERADLEGAAGRERVKEHFSVDRVVNGLDALYRDVLAEHR